MGHVMAMEHSLAKMIYDLATPELRFVHSQDFLDMWIFVWHHSRHLDCPSHQDFCKEEAKSVFLCLTLICRATLLSFLSENKLVGKDISLHVQHDSRKVFRWLPTQGNHQQESQMTTCPEFLEFFGEGKGGNQKLWAEINFWMCHFWWWKWIFSMTSWEWDRGVLEICSQVFEKKNVKNHKKNHKKPCHLGQI